MKILFIILFWFIGSQPCYGECPELKATCILNGFSYSRMCNCASDAPSYCPVPSNPCATCQLQGSPCSSAPTSSPCCLLRNGQAFCNRNTNKCEVVRYCAEDGTNCPFDDLSQDEITQTIEILKSVPEFSTRTQLSIIRRQEPHKAEWNAGLSTHRLAYAAVFNTKVNLLTEVVIDLHKGSIISRVDRPHQLPPISDVEFNEVNPILWKDHRVRRAIHRRKLNRSQVFFDVNALGSEGAPGNPIGKRLVRCTPYYQDKTTAYFDFRPIEGLEVTVDLNAKVVEDFQDIGIIPITSSRHILKKSNPNPTLKPLTITQPSGTSIRVKGQQIRWYKWKFMYSMDPVHGLQLFHVRYNADCEDRLVLYKISLSEMVVTYGAEGRQWRWRSFFDAGEVGIGMSAGSFAPNVDAPENAIFFNCTIANSATELPSVRPRCIATYERDTALLYKSPEVGSPPTSKRGRQLVFAFMADVGNYIYVFEYIFHMDGTLQVNIRLSGTILPRGTNLTTNDPHCLEECVSYVNDYLVAPAHQHIFNYRIDFDMDGPQNHALQVDVKNEPIGPQNPDGGVFGVKKKILSVESAEDYNVKTSRSWQVVNTQSRNRFNTPRGYTLKPGDMAYSYIHPNNPMYPQCMFTAHAFWGTVYKDEEQSAAGTFSRSGIPNQGLPTYVNGESLENTDIVAWYTFVVTHTTRAEEWPLMTIHNAGFSLVPYNFNSHNSEVPLKGQCN